MLRFGGVAILCVGKVEDGGNIQDVVALGPFPILQDIASNVAYPEASPIQCWPILVRSAPTLVFCFLRAQQMSWEGFPLVYLMTVIHMKVALDCMLGVSQMLPCWEASS